MNQDHEHMTHSGELAGKTVLITGASRGIGQAVAKAAAAAGATTLLCARDVRALEAIADAIEAAGGPAPILAPVNLETASLADYGELADLVAARCGCLDGLVFNAAALGELAPLASYDPVTWARVFQVNVHSVFLMLQTLLPLAMAAPSASVLFTLAAEGMGGKPHWGAYGASKFALRGLFEMLAAEHVNSASLHVNAVLPPPTRTRLRQAAYPAEHPGALADPAVIAPHYIRLLSTRAADQRGRLLTIPAT
ncbi:MAG: SDR family NAD(P)-dependent oxidoreductase [Proteobacteria bacterium]|nr:SDR family NAD(P)-dependent oxidoreductase [Pseudomonadota bacterium]